MVDLVKIANNISIKENFKTMLFSKELIDGGETVLDNLKKSWANFNFCKDNEWVRFGKVFLDLQLLDRKDEGLIASSYTLFCGANFDKNKIPKELKHKFEDPRFYREFFILVLTQQLNYNYFTGFNFGEANYGTSSKDNEYLGEGVEMGMMFNDYFIIAGSFFIEEYIQ